MNICIFSTTYFPNIGGAERFTHGLASYLTEKSEKVYVLVPFDQKTLTNFSAKYKILKLRFLSPVRRFKKLLEVALLLNLSFYHLKYHFDIVQAVVLYEPGYIAALFGKLFKISVVLRPTGEDIQWDDKSQYGKISNPPYQNKVLKALKSSSAIIAISPTVRKNILDFTEGDLKSKMVDIPNGVDLDKFGNGEIREIGGIREIRLLTVGRNVPKKDYPTMIKALSIVKKQIPNVVLYIVGGNQESLVPLIAELGILNEVTLLGQVPKEEGDFSQFPSKEVIDLYRSSDLFVFSSLIEGCPNVILEAIAAGLPIVAANSQGTWDYVIDMETGLLFNPSDPKDMADKIVKLLADKALYKQIKNNEQIYSKNFDWSKIAGKYLELYNKLIWKSH